MRKQLSNLNADDVRGAAALTEITAMARIGGFEVGKTMARAEVQSLRLDAARARRRGKPERSDELEKRAADYEKLLVRMEVGQERELTRAPVAEPGELLLTGRITDKGRPMEGLRADLFDASGNSVAHDVSDDLGHFTLRAPEDKAPKKIVISNGKGALLRSQAAPVLVAGQPAFIEIDLTGVKPRPPTEPPDDDDTSKDLAEVPAVTGLPAGGAAEKIEAAGLKAETQERTVDGAEPGTVVKQAPDAGTRVAKGSTVKLLIAASGSEEVPRLTGRRLPAAVAKLEESSFRLGKVELTRDSENAGKVLEQAPKEGAIASPGSAISVRVATGKDKADIQVAVALALTDARGIDLKLSEEALMKAFQRAKVKDIVDLGEFAKRPAAEVAKSLGISSRSHAVAARSLLADVARRFPTD